MGVVPPLSKIIIDLFFLVPDDVQRFYRWISHAALSVSAASAGGADCKEALPECTMSII